MQRLFTPILIAALAFSASYAHSAIPTQLTYQGYLTERQGAALTDEFFVTFVIYNVEVGGSPLWTDTMLMDVENGLFSVQLGRPANPFPTSLFDTPLWLGITVESDMEMIPRREITSVGFAFKADDAETVQGMSAFQLDQSDHVSDLGNPHSVTAEQSGAVSEQALDSHVTDASNPHQVTAAQTNAVDNLMFASHAAGPSAHHARFSDTEAVDAVIAADGPGSSLDADTLDGLQAAAFALQASSYDATQIDVLLQSLQSQIDALAGLPKFRDQGDGTILDSRTGLIWLKNANCTELGDLGNGGRDNRVTAINDIRELENGVCGLTDGSVKGEWYMPSAAEFATILDRTYTGPALSNADQSGQWTAGDPFVAVRLEGYWTSNKLDTAGRGWIADLQSGTLQEINAQSGFQYIWPVRRAK